MRGSTFVKPIEVEVRNWYDKLLRVGHIFDEWLKVQTNWLYLLPILSSPDISSEMPNEKKLFTQVNEIYCKYIDVRPKTSLISRWCYLIQNFLDLFLFSDGYSRTDCNKNDCC